MGMSTSVTDLHPALAWSGAGSLRRPARRIVSLLPSATEIVCALGLADRLVAVTHECDYPPDALTGIPRITANLLPPELRRSEEIDDAVRSAMTSGHGLYALDDAEVARLEPDLVLTQELCEVCAVAYPRVLEAARLAGGEDAPMIVSLEPHSLDDVFATIRLVARLARVEERGDALVEQLGRRMDLLKPSEPRRLVGLIEWLAPIFAPGHWVPDQVRLAGGTSVFGAAGERSRQSTWQTLADAQPECIVLGLCGFDIGRTLEEWDAFEPPEPMMETPAWRSGQVWAIDGSAYVSRPGPRLVDGIEALNAILTGRPDARASHLTFAVPSGGS
jgi:iron complex transport system substrate-binding protein